MPLSTRRLSACALIFDNRGHILLGDKLKYAALEFPGGKADDDETVLNTAIRELREETGIEVPHLRYLGYYDRHPKWVCHVFTGLWQSYANPPRTMEPDKHGDWRWYANPFSKKLVLTEVCQDVLELGFYEAAKSVAFCPPAYEGLVTR